MADLLSTAKSSFLLTQQAMATASHNIGNASNENYNRQEVNFVTNKPFRQNNYYIGSGSRISDIQRVSNQFVVRQLRTIDSALNELETIYDTGVQIDVLLSNKITGMTESIDHFFSSLTDVSDEPANLVNRNTLLAQARKMSSQFQLVSGQLSDQIDLNEQSIKVLTSEISSLSKQIAQLNQNILSNNAPDLLDQRDQYLDELSKRISVNVVYNSDRSVNVIMSSGGSLITGSQYSTLETLVSNEDNTVLDVMMNNNGKLQEINSATITGGQLGGALSLRKTLQETLRGINYVALGLSDDINQQHERGLDLQSQLGVNFFTDINAQQIMFDRVTINANNIGNANFSLAIDDITAIKPDLYRLTVSSNNEYRILNLTDNTEVTRFGMPQTIDGFTLTLESGVPQRGDTFLLDPTKLAATAIGVQVTNPASVALASPVVSESDFNNQGTALINRGDVVDITNASFAVEGVLSPPIRVEFLSDNSYQIVNDETDAVIRQPITYNPALNNELFPAPAIYNGMDPGLVNVSSLPVLATGDLIVNDIPIVASVPDTVSTTDLSASGIALATAINASTSSHNVLATVEPTQIALGSYTGGLLTAGQFQINGQSIITSDNSNDTLLSAINSISNTTGVRAEFVGSQLTLKANDGRNIELRTNGTATANFGAFDLTSGFLNQVKRAAINLTSNEPITISGSNPTNAGLNTATVSLYDPGYRFSMTGIAKKDDIFRIKFNDNAVNDNYNAREMIDIEEEKLFNNGRDDINNAYNEIVITVASHVNQVNLEKNANDAFRVQIKAQRDSISGVKFR